jgi:hypothetical protein
MVTPRNQRYKRKVNSALDLPKNGAADPERVSNTSNVLSLLLKLNLVLDRLMIW